ncbi:MAG: sigma-54 dependent transcriptional regulator [Bacteroidota bacterium]
MKQQLSILIIDDEESQRVILKGFLANKGYSVIEANSGTAGVGKAKKAFVDVVLTDFKMPDKNGLEVLREIRRINPEIAVVLMTAFGTIENAVEAMQAGAYSYLSKPIDLDELEMMLHRIAERQSLVTENKQLREQLVEKYSFTEIISHSKQMEEVLNVAVRVARSKASVLVRGESGTGKELIAKAIHFSSERREKPFVAVNSASLNEHLIESELFGHEKGSFTGAEKQRKGRFETANGGTLFLDEVGDLPLSTQVKLLRVLQEGTVERVGGTETLPVDVRVVAATHRNLEQMMKEGTFREDLFFRLNVVTIDIPPLRERKDDVIPLVDFFIAKYLKETKRKKLLLSKEALDTILKYEFPGNVRELENIVHRAVVLSRGEMISTGDLPSTLKQLPSEHDPSSVTGGSLSDQLESLEKKLLLDALQSSNGNQSKAAKFLGMTERNLRYRLQKLKLK